jgi:hypothetical protein
MKLKMNLNAKGEVTTLDLNVNNLIIAGWAGRDRDSMEHHIRELEALGVKRPKATPTFYRVSANRLTTDKMIQCNGEASSGEAETIIFAQDSKLYVGISSDHTDREVETYGITISKQVCDKPVGADLWPFEDVEAHWDQLILRSWLTDNGERRLYQEGSVATLLSPVDLIALYTGGEALPDHSAILGGTCPAIGGIRSGEIFECELQDPVLSRSLRLVYEIERLPIAG